MTQQTHTHPPQRAVDEERPEKHNKHNIMATIHTFSPDLIVNEESFLKLSGKKINNSDWCSWWTARCASEGLGQAASMCRRVPVWTCV